MQLQPQRHGKVSMQEEQPGSGKQRLERIGERYKRKRTAAEKVALDERSPIK